jgi:DNA-binding MarR family transcriptional regulator
MEQKTSMDIRRYAWILVGKAREEMLKARQKELAPYEISPRQAYVVDILYNLGRKATIAEVAKHVDREANTLAQQLNRMEKDGLVKRYQEKAKSTLLTFELTDKGVRAYENSLKREAIKKVMSVLSEEQLQILVFMMEQLINAAEGYHRD